MMLGEGLKGNVMLEVRGVRQTVQAVSRLD